MEFCVVFGKQSVMCEFSGEPKLEAFRPVVAKAFREMYPGSTCTFDMRLIPEGMVLSDDDSIAALSAGCTIEVAPNEVDMAKMLLRQKSIDPESGYSLERAVTSQDIETVRLILTARSRTDFYSSRRAFFQALHADSAPLCDALLSDHRMADDVRRAMKSYSRSDESGYKTIQRSPDILQGMINRHITEFSDTFYLQAATDGCEWVFSALLPVAADLSVLPSAVKAAVKADSVSTLRVFGPSVPQSDLSDALEFVLYDYPSKAHFCRVLMELGAEVPCDVLLGETECHEFFDVLIEHGAKIEQGCDENSTPLLETRLPDKQQALINLGANVNACNALGLTTLMLTPSHSDVVQLAITRGAEVNAFDHNGETCLMYACSEGACSSVDMLLSHGAELEATDNTGATALWYGVRSPPSHRVIPLLIERGSNVNVHDKEGKWFVQYMHWGSRSCWDKATFAIFKEVVALPQLDVNVADDTGRTLLMTAVRVDKSVAYILERKDIDVGAKDNEGMTCLLHAASAKRLPTCEEVLAYLEANKRMPDVNVQDNNGWTCMMHAVSAANCDSTSKKPCVRAQLVERLVACGADHSIPNTKGLTALHIAVQAKCETALSALLAAGACPNTQHGEVSLLHLAVSVKYAPSFETLLAAAEINLNSRDTQGRTALMRCARSCGVGWCEALLRRKDKGVDMSAQDENGWTCIAHAAASGNPKVVLLLLRHGGVGVDDGAVPPLLAAVLAASEPACCALLEFGATVAKPAADGRTCVGVAEGLRCRGAKAVRDLLRRETATPEAGTPPEGAGGDEPSPGGSTGKRKRDDEDQPPTKSESLQCPRCGASKLASGEPFPSVDSVIRHASASHRISRRDFIRRYCQ